ncbi:hypothetical protein BYT27DRAFT_7190074 [Phlegmacium glaucopus]|nr:hypothetical protein BYT27DRAFT_7190074 [Phlegmacium glaucopus]
MFACLTATPAPLLDLHIEPNGTVSEEQSSLVVDLNTLRVLLPPNPEVAWQCIVGICGRTITPMCTTLCNMLNNNFENVAQVLLDLELRHGDALEDILPVGVLDLNTINCVRPMAKPDLEKTFPNEQTRRKRRRSSDMTEHVITIPSRHVSAPTITISLCPPQAKETSCHIPYQDRAFGNRLTVPSHPVFNKIHPPMLLDHPSLPQLELDSWKWGNGHWVAVLPTPTEQVRKGMFSMVVMGRRRPGQTPRRNNKAASRGAI